MNINAILDSLETLDSEGFRLVCDALKQQAQARYEGAARGEGEDHWKTVANHLNGATWAIVHKI